MLALTLAAWRELLLFECVGLFGFKAVHRVVSKTTTARRTPSIATEDVVRAMTIAQLFYFKKVQCLQKSAVIARLLRRRGVPAEMVIGCHNAPMQAHAWVEVDRTIISGQYAGLEHFRVIDRW
jgi:hypothetical protein